MDTEQLKIGNCPHCTNVIFKNGVFISDASFTTRCPNCQKLLDVEIKTKIEITIRPAERYLSEKKPRFGKLSVIFGFTTQPLTAHCLLCVTCGMQACGYLCCRLIFI